MKKIRTDQYLSRSYLSLSAFSRSSSSVAVSVVVCFSTAVSRCDRELGQGTHRDQRKPISGEKSDKVRV